MATDITHLVEQLTGDLHDNAYKASDSLVRIGSESVVNSMVGLLHHPNPESRIIAARTLGLVENNADGLAPLLEAIHDPGNAEIAGDLLMALDGFDVSTVYVPIFKLYLTGSFKVSTLAKNLLDFKEFDITARVLKKAKKHWNHYSNNVKRDEIYELRKVEVEEMLSDLEAYIENNQ